jgi:hypothetical protein
LSDRNPFTQRVFRQTQLTFGNSVYQN